MSYDLDQIKFSIQRLDSEVGKSPFDESVRDILWEMYLQLVRLEGEEA